MLFSQSPFRVDERTILIQTNDEWGNGQNDKWQTFHIFNYVTKNKIQVGMKMSE